ncbi:hypothetical protein Pelo_2855 [Pelomyxa schiedti]|nr:hypothetical protein Pelo_2855 [Pelomyxa schiedti]
MTLSAKLYLMGWHLSAYIRLQLDLNEVCQVIPASATFISCFYEHFPKDLSCTVWEPYGMPLHFFFNHTCVTRDITQEILSQSVKAVSYLQLSQVVHRNLSRDNIRVVNFNKYFQVKLIDFTSSVKCETFELDYELQPGDGFLWSYRAPEIDFPFTEPKTVSLLYTDIYSVGLSMSEVLFGNSSLSAISAFELGVAGNFLLFEIMRANENHSTLPNLQQQLRKTPAYALRSFAGVEQVTTLFALVIKLCHIPLLKFILDELQVDPNVVLDVDNNTPLHVAVESKSLEAVKRLIAIGADPDSRQRIPTPLQSAKEMLTNSASFTPAEKKVIQDIVDVLEFRHNEPGSVAAYRDSPASLPTIKLETPQEPTTPGSPTNDSTSKLSGLKIEGNNAVPPQRDLPCSLLSTLFQRPGEMERVFQTWLKQEGLRHEVHPSENTGPLCKVCQRFLCRELDSRKEEARHSLAQMLEHPVTCNIEIQDYHQLLISVDCLLGDKLFLSGKETLAEFEGWLRNTVTKNANTMKKEVHAGLIENDLTALVQSVLIMQTLSKSLVRFPFVQEQASDFVGWSTQRVQEATTIPNLKELVLTEAKHARFSPRKGSCTLDSLCRQLAFLGECVDQLTEILPELNSLQKKRADIGRDLTDLVMLCMSKVVKISDVADFVEDFCTLKVIIDTKDLWVFLEQISSQPESLLEQAIQSAYEYCAGLLHEVPNNPREITAMDDSYKKLKCVRNLKDLDERISYLLHDKLAGYIGKRLDTLSLIDELRGNFTPPDNSTSTPTLTVENHTQGYSSNMNCNHENITVFGLPLTLYSFTSDERNPKKLVFLKFQKPHGTNPASSVKKISLLEFVENVPECGDLTTKLPEQTLELLQKIVLKDYSFYAVHLPNPGTTANASAPSSGIVYQVESAAAQNPLRFTFKTEASLIYDSGETSECRAALCHFKNRTYVTVEFAGLPRATQDPAYFWTHHSSDISGRKFEWVFGPDTPKSGGNGNDVGAQIPFEVDSAATTKFLHSVKWLDKFMFGLKDGVYAQTYKDELHSYASQAYADFGAVVFALYKKHRELAREQERNRVERSDLESSIRNLDRAIENLKSYVAKLQENGEMASSLCDQKRRVEDRQSELQHARDYLEFQNDLIWGVACHFEIPMMVAQARVSKLKNAVRSAEQTLKEAQHTFEMSTAHLSECKARYDRAAAALEWTRNRHKEAAERNRQLVTVQQKLAEFDTKVHECMNLTSSLLGKNGGPPQAAPVVYSIEHLLESLKAVASALSVDVSSVRMFNTSSATIKQMQTLTAQWIQDSWA